MLSLLERVEKNVYTLYNYVSNNVAGRNVLWCPHVKHNIIISFSNFSDDNKTLNAKDIVMFPN